MYMDITDFYKHIVDENFRFEPNTKVPFIEQLTKAVKAKITGTNQNDKWGDPNRDQSKDFKIKILQPSTNEQYKQLAESGTIPKLLDVFTGSMQAKLVMKILQELIQQGHGTDGQPYTVFKLLKQDVASQTYTRLEPKSTNNVLSPDEVQHTMQNSLAKRSIKNQQLEKMESKAIFDHQIDSDVQARMDKLYLEP